MEYSERSVVRVQQGHPKARVQQEKVQQEIESVALSLPSRLLRATEIFGTSGCGLERVE